MSEMSIHRLKPHPKNPEYYADLDGDKYEELRRSIEAHGIRDPLKVLPDGTIIAGHQRWRIAKELGLERVPVVIYDIPEQEAEYLLIADNEERRGEDHDPMRKARRAKFLAEYWGIRRGGARKGVSGHERAKGQFVPLKSIEDIGEQIGEDVRTTKRLLKLNDLIPELQALVSSGKLGTTAAEQLAYLSPETQRALYAALGDEIAARTVAETKELRKRLEEAEKQDRETVKLQQELAILRERGRDEDRERIAELESEIRRLQNRPVERVEVIPDAVRREIEDWKRRAVETDQERQALEEKYESLKVVLQQHQERIERLRAENARLKEGAELAQRRETSTTQTVDPEWHRIEHEQESFHELMQAYRTLHKVVSAAADFIFVSDEEAEAFIQKLMREYPQKAETWQSEALVLRQAATAMERLANSLERQYTTLRLVKS
ncbi:ParB N-terminal domain-containing protein [Alicyclobacillus mali]|uniref:ParB N-terminal domain-containing protein n=1 Tax=Alicyclobacillus mali (ex Roth et al. 2021) TaxID=1123961 RepID=A0ABS0EZ96_9BACL|nr:ParB N-terminal domain-containing protein [Alicyclobacillus mali (ex Roth et al. 2021)]MBF8376350.1 ParB N-terminal domain-containing protein [Alicyclobacillus mali (ex Roth et al. 2021)]